MTPSQLKNKIEARSTELTSEILTAHDVASNHARIKAKIREAMLASAVDAIEVILKAYGEFTRISPAYDRMKATLAEVKTPD